MSTLSRRKLCRSWKLYAITCPEQLAGRDPQKVVEEAILGGADVIQLRDKKADERQLLRQAKELLVITRKHGVPLIVNDHIRIAKESGADGVHLGQEDGPLADARKILGESALIGRSTHSPEQAIAAEQEGFDYVGVGPVYPTPTKPGRAATGLDLIRFASEKLEVPYVAIGGIDLSNLAEVVEAGAIRIAFVRALTGQPKPEEAAKKLLSIMRKEG